MSLNGLSTTMVISDELHEGGDKQSSPSSCFKKGKKALIDGDGVLYLNAIRFQTEIQWDDEDERSGKTTFCDTDAAFVAIKLDIKNILKATGCNDYLFCLSDNRQNYFRNKILPTYKANRTQPKPQMYPFLKAQVIKNFNTLSYPTLEADDCLGLLADEDTVLVSLDKDLDQIAGEHYNWRKDKLYSVTPEDADYQFFYQCLVGDSTDNYKGCPRVGDKGARKILDEDCSWEAVVKAYEGKGLTEEDALVQARVARILRAGEYERETGEIKLFNVEE